MLIKTKRTVTHPTPYTAQLMLHLHIFDPKWKPVLWKRSLSHGGFRGPLSGTLRVGESIEECAVRELFEETGLLISVSDVVNTNHSFECFTRRGNYAFGRTAYTILPEAISPSNIRFNGELVAIKILNPWEAPHSMDAKEARSGFHHILTHCGSDSGIQPRQEKTAGENPMVIPKLNAKRRINREVNMMRTKGCPNCGDRWSLGLCLRCRPLKNWLESRLGVTIDERKISNHTLNNWAKIEADIIKGEEGKVLRSRLWL